MQERIGKASLWLTVILPFALGYFIAMAFRSINAILAHPLMQDLGLGNVEMGWITSVFLLTFALVQLPLGVLLDYWGPRKTQTLLFVVGAVGITLFGFASDVAMLALGRGILGIGMAGGLMAAVKAVADWCHEQEIPFYNGIILGAGGLGALMVTTPAKLFELEFGWRGLCFAMAALTLVIAALVFFGGRDEPRSSSDRSSLWSHITGLKAVYTDRFFWQLAPVLIFSLGGFIALRGLWLGPWLQYVVGLSPLESANYLFAISVAMTLGLSAGGLYAWLAARLRQPLILVVVVVTAIFIAAEILVVLNFAPQNYLIWIAFGFFGQVSVVHYAVIAQHFGPQLSGRAVTGANIFVFLFAFAAQYAFGVVLSFWPNDTGAGQPVGGYEAAFWGLIVLQLFSLAWFVLLGRRSRERRDQGPSRV